MIDRVKVFEADRAEDEAVRVTVEEAKTFVGVPEIVQEPDAVVIARPAGSAGRATHFSMGPPEFDATSEGIAVPTIPDMVVELSVSMGAGFPTTMRSLV